ncbi:lens fiber membrane intrinsic protein-like [Pomacea canaliculata]|uniref:lens fiber membrane intrinsic protein-like n=1 Tax=Pomacea canaliculata TaxID=400727 RepID=UPI000D726EFC|nr:lens fiber membrane intrinsic protein-like [Pomacea canaliculata]
MAIKVPKIPVCGAIACCGVALIFQLVAVAGTGWFAHDYTENGLFRSCYFGSCGNLSEGPDWWKACQAFSILGLLTIAGSLVLGILHALLDNTRNLSLGGIASSAASALLLVAELAVFGGMTNEVAEDINYGYGFILSVIACVLSAIAAGLFAFGLRK